jgi:adsorption protein B
VVSNFVNFMAVCRAWRLFLSYLFRGRQLVWDKTMHDFPTGAQLARRRQRLGELLRSWQAVDEGSLDIALAEQTSTGQPLGQILVSNGWLDEETLAEAIAYQADLPRAHLTAQLVREHADRLPADFGTRFRAVHIGTDQARTPQLAVASPLSAESLAQLTTFFGMAPRQRIVRESEIAIGLRLVRGGSDGFASVQNGSTGVPLLGDTLIAQGLLKRDVFETAMRTYRPDKHGRVGDYLVERGVILRADIERVVIQQRQLQRQLEISQPAKAAA